MATVIVFGPTGNVASVAAKTAQEKGAKVWLAMRDPKKPIPGLSAEHEKSGGFQRVQADLSQPDTLTAAVKTSGATHAFIYLVHASTDHMKGAVAALKTAGITSVVFLSSFTVGRPDRKLQDIEQSSWIPYAHARVEMSLDEVYGPDNYVAVRPGGFATNVLRYKSGIQSGEVKMYGAGLQQDMITPDDMGRVSGAILAQGLPKDGQRKVLLYGPQILTVKEGVEIAARALGKEIKFSSKSADETRAEYEAAQLPKPAAEYMVRVLGDHDSDKGDLKASWFVDYEEGVENVKKYTGKPSTAYEDWVKANLQLFQ